MQMKEAIWYHSDGFVHMLKASQVLTISIHLIDHILQLCLCGILSQRAHDSPQFFGGDGPITIFVKEWKCLFEFCR